jgi:hypothetical protein
MVSFDRPYARNDGSEDLFEWDIQSIRWLERNGFDVSYTTSVDVSERPELLLNHLIFVSGGHDEYWSHSMYKGVIAARDAGVNLAFFGADAAYWQVRYQPDAAGHADRTLICYKVLTGSTDSRYKPNRDPDYPSQKDLVTTLFRDPILNEPENGLLGAMFNDEIAESGPYYPDWVVSNQSDPYLAGTGLAPGDTIAGGLLGYEYDSIVNNGHSPPGLIDIAHSLVRSYQNPAVMNPADTTIYRAASGALVFDAGSIWWSWGLDSFSMPNVLEVTNRLGGNASIQLLTKNIFAAMLLPQAS